MSANLATQYLRDHNETLADYNGVCGEIANAIMRNEDHALWVEGDIPWKYHMVALVDGLVHDAWCEGDALSPRDWLIKMFGPNSNVVVALDGDDFFFGPCHDFSWDGVAATEEHLIDNQPVEESLVDTKHVARRLGLLHSKRG